MNISSIQSNYSTSTYQSASASSSQTQDFQAIMERRLARMEEAVESGEISVSDLQEELQSRFGDAVNEAFGEDGSVDFDKLLEIIQSQAPAEGQGMQPPMGPPPPPPPDEHSGTEIDPTKLQASLIDTFGEEAEGIVSEDGTIDFEKLKELIDEKLASESSDNSYYGNSSTAKTTSFMSPVVLDVLA